MALPHFHGGLVSPDPIFLNRYDGLFITNNGDKFVANIERFEIVDNVITCKIQNYPESTFSNINDSVVLLIEHSNKIGNIIRIDILGIEIKNYRSEFDWSREDLSHIDVSFTITSSKSLYGDELSITSKEDFIKSIIRDKKLAQLLK